MQVKVDSPFYDTKEFESVPYLDASAVLSEDGRYLSLFCVNRSKEAMELDMRAVGLEGLSLVEHFELRNEDIKATNTEAAPERVAPKSVAVGKADASGGGSLRLAPLSYSFLRYSMKA
jgi:alpha-N-arabinofuranosidase